MCDLTAFCLVPTSYRGTRATVATDRNTAFSGSSRYKPKKNKTMGDVLADKETAFDRTRDGVRTRTQSLSDPAHAVEPYEPKEIFAFLEELALALVASAAQQLALLVLAHLLAPLLDHVAQGIHLASL